MVWEDDSVLGQVLGVAFQLIPPHWDQGWAVAGTGGKQQAITP